MFLIRQRCIAQINVDIEFVNNVATTLVRWFVKENNDVRANFQNMSAAVPFFFYPIIGVREWKSESTL